MATITFTVTISGGGTGVGVFINVNEQNLFFPTSGSQTMELDPGNYIAVVSGSEPSDDSVNVQISENDTVLRSSDFSQTSFFGLMAFTVS